MDAKDLRIEPALGAHTNDGSTKYAQSGPAPHADGTKPYHDIGSTPLVKVDVPTARPCAIIGPDRVIPQHSTSDLHNIKKAPVEPWPCSDNLYRHPPEYPHKTDYHPPRNISPRQTFQENMSRIMVPPIYASKGSEDHSLSNSKLPPDVKYCEVPYTISPMTSEPKIIKSSDMNVSNNNPAFAQTVPAQGWPGRGVNMRPIRPYGAPELYPYPEYSNCTSARPVSMIRPHRNVHEDVPHIYSERFYHEANARFKPYPTTKDRQSQVRYDYMPSYPNSFQPPAAFPPHKFDLQKSMAPHPYPVYPPLPLKYLDRRMPAPALERYRRSPNPQPNFTTPFGNQNIPTTYGPVPGHCLQNRPYPYSPDPTTKTMIQNRLYFDNNNSRKCYPTVENIYVTDINRSHNVKNDGYPPYSSINIHSLPPHHVYRKDTPMKNYEQHVHYRNFDYSANMNALPRLPFQFSPQTIAISPCDSNISNDATTLGIGQEDCGYVSQSSSTSVRSIESAVNRMSNDIFQRQNIRGESSLLLGNARQKLNSTENSKDKKGLNVRQFLQMWNEGDDEVSDSSKDIAQKDSSKGLSHYETLNSQEQLYVLGLVNVPNHELGKYDHIQKISKLPENIKGYNNIELLNEYEKLVESTNMNNFTPVHSQQQQKKTNLHVQSKMSLIKQGIEMLPRPISPLDVEAKISQSVIHKEVRCNFEIKPCSPQMLNVDIATPVQNVLGERLIEKVVNPAITKVPIIQRIDDISIDTSLRNSPKIPSCKMVNNHYPSPNITDHKTNYSIQDLESNSGVCLSSLPRLDNDIELSFPEINQQFINANKIESPNVPFMRDLLEPDNVDNRPLSRDKIQKQSIIDQVTSGSDSDKEFVKLSKYRKQKRSTSLSKENENNTSPTVTINRTDSVIIKNPDNIKSQEHFINQNLPNNMNVSSALNLVQGSCTDDNYNEKYTNGVIDNYNSKDTAIDFRLNKTTDEHNINSDEINNTSESLLNNFDTETSISEEFSNFKSSDNTQIETNPISMPNLNSISASNLDDITCSEKNNVCDIPSDSKYISNEININLEETNKIEYIGNNPQDSHDTVITHLKQNKAITDVTSSITELINEEIITQTNLPISSHEFSETSVSTNVHNINLGFEYSTIAKEHDDQLLNDSAVGDAPAPLSNIENISGYNPQEKNAETPSLDTNQEVESYRPLNDTDQVIAELISSNLSRDSPYVCKDKKLHDELNNERDVICEEIQKIECHKNEKKTINDDIGIKSPYSESENDILMTKNNNELTSNEINNIRNSDVTEYLEENHLTFCSTSLVHSIEIIAPQENFDKDEIIDNNLGESSVMEIDCDANKTSCNIEDNNESEECTATESSISNINPQLKNFERINYMTVNHNDTDHMLPPLDKETNELKMTHEEHTQIEDTETNDQKLHVHPFAIRNCYIKNDSYFRKEMSSPWFQKLLLFNEGPVLSSSKQINENDKLTEICEINNSITHTAFNTENNENLLTENQTAVNDTNEQEANISCVCIENPDQSKLDVFLNECKNNEWDVPSQTDNENSSESKDIECINENVYIEPESTENDFVESLLVLTEDQIDENNGTIQNDIQIKLELKDIFNGKSLPDNLANTQFPVRRSRTLKRSLSDSAAYNANDSLKVEDLVSDFAYCNKRKKVIDSQILVESEMIAQNLNSYIQNNRRNSISTIYNDNVSFCIVIDNDCVLAEENEETQKICFTQVSDDSLSAIMPQEEEVNTEVTEAITCHEENYEYNNDIIIHNVEGKSIEDNWIEDVACMETVFSDDIAEDIIISAPTSPKECETSEDEIDNTESVFIHNVNEHSDKIKCIYGDQMSDDDAQLVEKLYRTPQMDVNKTLINSESRVADECDTYYNEDSLEKMLSESTSHDIYLDTANEDVTENSPLSLSHNDNNYIHENKGKLDANALFAVQANTNDTEPYPTLNLQNEFNTKLSTDIDPYQYCNESSCNNSVPYDRKEDKTHYAISSSPEVSSTTPEERSTGILLKIKNYKGTKISEINEMGAEHRNMSGVNNELTTYMFPRPLITKAAQKYIPPLRETIRDLKVKLRLPQQSLYKLKQLKKSKEEPKVKTSHSASKIKSLTQEKPKKVKPKFEDVLKSIDEIQFKKHKEKSKKVKQVIPKVIIKKNENGAHYASTQNAETFNPDLTGRKWQPWVFIEKNNFIDKMALKQKVKAVYSHRKKTYVLAESFRKYKSISSAKFIITHPKESMSTGKLKYTIRLKHN